MKMYPESKDQIIKNFQVLMKDCVIDDNLLKILMDKKVFSPDDLDNMSTPEQRHNKRVFFFELQKKSEKAFQIFLDSLKQTNQHGIAELLQVKHHSGKVFQQMKNYDLDNSIDEMPNTPISKEMTMEFPLLVKVKSSNEFWDVIKKDQIVPVYSARSKKRGRALIINNYDFPSEHYRNGATIDNANLEQLLTQMGGWDIITHFNKPADAMLKIIKDFAQAKNNENYDICLLIIMSHGNEHINETIIYGLDQKHIRVATILKEFTNLECSGFNGKPKIFLFQVCRGIDLHQRIRTEVDSQEKFNPLSINLRHQEDMLIGYATLLGSKAHRNSVKGSWYIEVLCEIFMKYAHNTSVNDMMVMVDRELKRKVSEWDTVQTSEFHNIGFKKLFLNPGIYQEKVGNEDVLKKFTQSSN